MGAFYVARLKILIGLAAALGFSAVAPALEAGDQNAGRTARTHSGR